MNKGLQRNFAAPFSSALLSVGNDSSTLVIHTHTQKNVLIDRRESSGRKLERGENGRKRGELWL